MKFKPGDVVIARGYEKQSDAAFRYRVVSQDDVHAYYTIRAFYPHDGKYMPGVAEHQIELYINTNPIPVEAGFFD